MGTNIRAHRRTLLYVLILALAPLALILAVETVARLSFSAALRWMFLADSANTLRFTYLWVAACVVALYAAINRLRLATLLSLLTLLVFAAIHAGKERILQQPLLPGDFALIGMIARVWSAAYFPFTWAQVGAAALIAGCGAAFCRLGLPDWRLSRRQRFLLGPAALGLLALFSAQTRLFASRDVPLERKLTVTWSPQDNLSSERLAFPGTQNPDFSASFNYRCFGLIPGFLLHFDPRETDGESLPHDYSAAAVRQTWDNLPAPPPVAEAPADAGEQPHVVVVLSESFWDPRWLEGVTITPDPLPAFRRLGGEANGRSFTTVSPIFGGYTCNAEFELLTGIALAALPRGTVPHTGPFGDHIPSLPAVFKASGYRTVAIHPFLPEFWNRNLVYPQIGFDRFIHLGTMTHREVRGKFISDAAVADEILDTLAAEAAPAFVFAITMQNHSPYGDGRYGEVETATVRVDLPSVDAAGVRDYVHGIRDADAMLDSLTRRLAASERRVLLVFLGDHQPNLVPVETEPGQFSQSLRPDAVAPNIRIGRKFVGPALAWSSRGRPAAPPAAVSLAALPAWVLRQANLPLPPFFRLSEHVFGRFPVLHRNWGITADGKACPLRLPFTDPVLQDYQVVCHDLLLGKNFSRFEMRRFGGEKPDVPPPP